MKLVIVCLIALIVSAGLAMLAIEDPGYVVLAWDPYVVRMPLLFLILILFVAFIVLYLFFNFLGGLFRAPKKLGKMKQRMNEDAAPKFCIQGFTGLIEGRWDHAEARLMKKIDSSRMPLIHYLGAAYAALQQGHLERRDRYLDQALAIQPDQSLSIELTRARFHCHAGEFDKARNVLEFLRIDNARSKPVVRLLADVYQHLGDWEALREMLPTMKRLNVFPKEDFEAREQLAWDRLILSENTLAGPSAEEAPLNWSTLPSKHRRNPAIISSWVRLLLRKGEAKEAEKVLRRALRKTYDPRLIHLYGQVRSPFVSYQIEFAETFLKTRPDDPELLLALARLHRHERNFEASISMYERAMAAGARDEVYTDLASLYEQMGDSDTALTLYKKGFEALEHQSEQNTGDAAPATERALTHEVHDEAQLVKGIIPVVR
ncbi:MAG: tetratricopeptide repeat protein [Gammaproteobacteria bacterium]|nr:tetratricopeptide repeat protein [Gammaproteobacteria bacterium]